jgi:hypothetical protein
MSGFNVGRPRVEILIPCSTGRIVVGYYPDLPGAVQIDSTDLGAYNIAAMTSNECKALIKVLTDLVNRPQL